MAHSERDKSDPREQYKCPICLENVRRRHPMSTKCGHVFCSHCIEIALENFCKKCPVCNQDLDEPIFPINLISPCLCFRNTVMRQCRHRLTPVNVCDGSAGFFRNGKGTADEMDTTHYTCPKCAKEVIHFNPVATECGHVFCEDCIGTKCIVCKKDIDKEKLVRLYL